MLQIISSHTIEVLIIASIPISIMLRSLLRGPSAWREHRSTLWLLGLNLSLLAALAAINYTDTIQVREYVMDWSDEEAPVILDAQLAHTVPPSVPDITPVERKAPPIINLKKEIIIETTPKVIETDLSTVLDEITLPDPEIYIATEPTAPPALPVAVDEPAEIRVWVQNMPRFPGCEDLMDDKERSSCAEQKLLEFIAKTVKYPEPARQADISGIAVVQFVVSISGSIEQIEIVRDPGGGLGREAASAVAAMNDMALPWIAGHDGRRSVPVRFTLPIRFTNQ